MSRGNDLELYERNAANWWTPGHRMFRSLHSVGRFHLSLIESEWGRDLRGARIADLGCGGGHMAMALELRGARVTGLDSSRGSVAAARVEARRRESANDFVCGDIARTPFPSQRFDFVVMSDVIEHTETPESALREAGRLLRPGGRLFVNTFNRSRASTLLVVNLAEGLGLVPRGTHDPRLFIRPQELTDFARRGGMQLDRLVWEKPALLRSALTWTIHLRQARRGFGFSAFYVKDSA